MKSQELNKIVLIAVFIICTLINTALGIIHPDPFMKVYHFVMATFCLILLKWIFTKGEKKSTENRSYSHLYGTMGKPTFFCSKNFISPNHEEPCGIHQADLWCIINGNVCPNLIFGLEPIIEESKGEQP